MHVGGSTYLTIVVNLCNMNTMKNCFPIHTPSILHGVVVVGSWADLVENQMKIKLLLLP